jgi:hypothetical protein
MPFLKRPVRAFLSTKTKIYQNDGQSEFGLASAVPLHTMFFSAGEGPRKPLRTFLKDRHSPAV